MNTACEVCRIALCSAAFRMRTGAQPPSPNHIRNCNWTAHSAAISKCRKNGYLEYSYS